MPLLAILLLLCVSLHACNARHPAGVIRAQDHHHVIEEGEKTTLVKLSPLSIPFSIVSKRIQTQQIVIQNTAGSTVDSLDGANMMKEKTSSISGNERNEKIVLTSKEGSKQTTKVQDWKRSQARKMLGSSKQDNEENVDSKDEADLVEDVVAMDYAQPRRKPPIHNEEH